MKVILIEKINKLGDIGDTVEVKTGFARNFLLPNNKALRWSKLNLSLFEAKKAELKTQQTVAVKSAQSQVDVIKNAKVYMIRQAGDTGQLYGSVSSRDVSRMLSDITKINIGSAQVMLGTPIKSVGMFDTNIVLHADVIVPIKVYVAQTQDEIEALVAGKVLTFGNQRVLGTGRPELDDQDLAEFLDPVEIEAEVVEAEVVEAKPVKTEKAETVEVEAEVVEAEVVEAEVVEAKPVKTEKAEAVEVEAVEAKPAKAEKAETK